MRSEHPKGAIGSDTKPPGNARRLLLAKTYDRLALANRDDGVAKQQVDMASYHLTNLAQAPGQVSACSFQPDRTIFREEFRDGTMEDFALMSPPFKTALATTLGNGVTPADITVHVRPGSLLVNTSIVAQGMTEMQAIAAYLKAVPPLPDAQ